jgi:hypothetical protein
MGMYSNEAKDKAIFKWNNEGANLPSTPCVRMYVQAADKL